MINFLWPAMGRGSSKLIEAVLR